MDKAISFYIDKLELKLVNRYGDHYAEVDANGFMIGLHPSNKNTKTGNNISIGLGVFNFEQTIANLESKGIKFKLENEGYIRIAHFTDSDGNLLFLAEKPRLLRYSFHEYLSPHHFHSHLFQYPIVLNK